jgi:hypothetical protein
MIISGNVHIFFSISKLKYCLIFILFESTVHPKLNRDAVRRYRQMNGRADGQRETIIQHIAEIKSIQAQDQRRHGRGRDRAGGREAVVS